MTRKDSFWAKKKKALANKSNEGPPVEYIKMKLTNLHNKSQKEAGAGPRNYSHYFCYKIGKYTCLRWAWCTFFWYPISFPSSFTSTMWPWERGRTHKFSLDFRRCFFWNCWWRQWHSAADETHPQHQTHQANKIDQKPQPEDNLKK